MKSTIMWAWKKLEAITYWRIPSDFHLLTSRQMLKNLAKLLVIKSKEWKTLKGNMVKKKKKDYKNTLKIIHFNA